MATQEEKTRECSALGDVGEAIEKLRHALLVTRHHGVIECLGDALTAARRAEAMLQDQKDRWL